VIRRHRGTALSIIFLLLAGCVAPMGQREAELRASHSLRNFCAASPCGTPRLVKTQKLKDRWLVDFETAGGLYTVAVDSGGNANVTVWDKNSAR
jgi:hypothetical protein